MTDTGGRRDPASRLVIEVKFPLTAVHVDAPSPAAVGMIIAARAGPAGEIGERDMINSSIIQRVILISHNNSVGTAFTIEVHRKQYFLTARHVVENISFGDNILVWRAGKWNELEVNIVGLGIGGIDVAVLSCTYQLTPAPQLNATAEGLGYSQHVYFLGFPFGWKQEMGRINNDYPIPFVKSGIVSAFADSPSGFYIDGHVNPGFSGGPVVFRPSKDKDGKLCVAGIVSGSPDSPSPTHLSIQGKPLVHSLDYPDLVHVVQIGNAIELIELNAQGYALAQLEQ